MEVEHKPFAQKKPDQLVYLELGAGNGGMLLSISGDGFRFRAVSPVRAAGTMPFAFSLDGKHRLAGSGTVEWLEEDGKSGGMRFAEVSEEFHAALTGWLACDSQQSSLGREVTPAAAEPLDTMEKIRQELRAGYPPSSRAAEPTVAPPVLASSQDTDERPLKPSFSQPSVESRKSRPARQPSSSISRAAEPERPSSAFLKKPIDSKSSPPVSPLVSVRPTPPAAAASASIKPAEPPVSGERRPYIPPFEDSFETAWERAKLTAPPESPHLSRAAAGSIIAIALAVILGALAYNFRQDIGDAFIRLGHEISGDRRAAAPAAASDQTPAPQNAQPKSPDLASPSQTIPGEAGSASQASDPSHIPAANGTSASGTPAKNGALSVSGAEASRAGPAVGTKPRETSPVEERTDVAAKPQTPLEPATGQEEFNIAREILQGSNRKRELPRAVDLLWSGVRKGYVPAEVTLADLFLRGDGVEKNCDQARVLLVAASKKGSLDARQMLEQMAEQGCE
jgi:hypothetical protein